MGGRPCEDRAVDDLRFRLASEGDLPCVVRLRDAAARWMLARGVTGQWQPGELGVEHFRRVSEIGEVWLGESTVGVVGAWELWWEDEDAWGPRASAAGYVYWLMVAHADVPPGTGRRLLRAAEQREAATGRGLGGWTAWRATHGSTRTTSPPVTVLSGPRRANRNRTARSSRSPFSRRTYGTTAARSRPVEARFPGLSPARFRGRRLRGQAGGGRLRGG
ncbi:hypothetical protein SCALM49S_04333 [Streptomyces californicus]